MESKIVTEPLEAGYRVLLPGVEYEVIKTFEDNEGRRHPEGENWTFLGWRPTREHSGLAMYVKNVAGEVFYFRLLSLKKEQSIVFSCFENYVVGNPPSSESYISRLDESALEALRRCEQWISPIPDNSEDFFRKRNSARGNAHIASGRAGYEGNHYQKIEADLNFLYKRLIETSKKA